MLLLVLMIFSRFEKTFCKVFLTFVICTASQLICSRCNTWNDIQTFSNVMMSAIYLKTQYISVI